MPKQYNAGTVRKGSPGIFVVTSRSEIGFICLAGKLGDRVDFLINDETYFLSLAENERRWQVFVQTPRERGRSRCMRMRLNFSI